jgi:hypothetical protein
MRATERGLKRCSRLRLLIPHSCLGLMRPATWRLAAA